MIDRIMYPLFLLAIVLYVYMLITISRSFFGFVNAIASETKKSFLLTNKQKKRVLISGIFVVVFAYAFFVTKHNVKGEVFHISLVQSLYDLLRFIALPHFSALVAAYCYLVLQEKGNK